MRAATAGVCSVPYYGRGSTMACEPTYSALMPAALMSGHHLSISAL